jgi:folate-dependent phosphoribosylglycinamide formyltransferase PurN
VSQDAPSKVVVFTGGAVLEDACVALISRVRAHPELELAAVFCETRAVGLSGLARDLLRRRGWLAPAMLLQHLLERVVRPLFAPASERARRRALREAESLVHFVADLHAPEVLAELRALRPDIGAVYGGPILRPALFEIPAHGTIGIHHGRLPDYRGKKTTFWAMYNGEDTVGVAIQRIGTGLDRGDVLRDGVMPVGRSPLPAVKRRLERLGHDLYLDALLSIHRGSATYRPQPRGEGPLYRDPRAVDIVRFWVRYLRRLMAPRSPDRSARS